MNCSSHKQIRNNLKYVFFLSITLILREIFSELIKRLCVDAPKILLIFLRYGGEIIIGSIYYLLNIKTTVSEKNRNL